MLEQQGNSLTAIAHFTESKIGKTGLTVTVDVYEDSTQIVTAASATEIGTSGAYYYTLSSSSVDANALYLFVFKTATSTVDQQHIPALWIVGRGWVNRVDATISSVTTAVNAVIANLLNTVATTFTTSSTVGKAINNLLSFLTVAPPTTAQIETQLSDDFAALPTATENAGAFLAAAITGGTVQEALENALTTVGLTAADFWAYAPRTLTMTAAEIEESLTGSDIIIRRGDSYTITLTGLGDLTGYTSLWFTGKDDDVSDSFAMFQIKKNASGLDDGLLYAGGSLYTTPTHGSITILDLVAGNIRIDMDEAATKLFPVHSGSYDVQSLISGTVTTRTIADYEVVIDYSRSIT